MVVVLGNGGVVFVVGVFRLMVLLFVVIGNGSFVTFGVLGDVVAFVGGVLGDLDFVFC